MIVLTCEDHGCAYSIDSEGTLYYSVQYNDGSINVEDWDEVDHMALLGDECEYKTIVDTIHEQLIAMSKLIGEYYQA
jgi:hypothetical protein|tara:strand:+ start:266 stop:496 length:231 start_codon:yes stop_codon:yes gene_type:complete